MEEQKATPIKPFDVYRCPLTGRNMVTAGAGTGKTYSIQILFLRMILADIPVKKILVVTFTNLATDELKNRLRQVLQTASDLCCALCAAEDDNARLNLLEDSAYQQVAPCLQNADINDAARKLQAAMRDFDSAPISTIHGFCSRILRDNAFDSGVRYGMDMRTSVKALTKLAFSQFWRKFSNEGKPNRQLAVKLAGLTPDSMMNDLDVVFSNPGVPVSWDVTQEQLQNATTYLERIETSPFWKALPDALGNLDDADMDELENHADITKGAIKQAFSKDQMTFWKQLGNNVTLNAAGLINSNDLKNLLKAPEVLDNLLKNAMGNEDFLSLIFVQNKKKQVEAFLQTLSGRPSLNGYVSALADVLKLHLLLMFYKTFLLSLATWDARKAIELAKGRDGFMTYDDLLLILSSRLGDGTVGQRLRKVIQEQYAAVIVDEFQDTDAHQSAIFNALLAADGSHEDLERRTYFMIGDEKQAIYMFRGGDVHTFFKEKKACGGNVFSLTRNFRSSSAFINAMNTFWEDSEPDFFQPDNTIRFEHIDDPALNGGRRLQLLRDDNEITDGLLDIQHSKDVKLTIAQLVSEYTEKKPGGKHTRYAMQTVKGNDATCNDVRLSDIAVLVRTKSMGFDVRDFLRSNGIPAVILKGKSIFKTDEGRQMLYFLDAVLNPGDNGKAMFLLMQNLFALPASQLEAIRADCLPKFQVFLKKLLDEWQKKSFLQMFRTFMHTEFSRMMPGIVFKEQLPEADDADDTQATVIRIQDTTLAVRIATVNSRDSLALFMQAADKLHAVSLEKRLGPLALFDFLDTHTEKQSAQSYVSDEDQNTEDSIDEAEDDDELYAASLPTQDDAVRILTIHASKGLQFPFVIVPNFSRSNSKKTNCIYQDGTSGRTVSMGQASDDIKESCSKEQFAEQKRLMYVAITRAQFACRFISSDTPQTQPDMETINLLEEDKKSLDARLAEAEAENKSLGRNNKNNPERKEQLKSQINELKAQKKEAESTLKKLQAAQKDTEKYLEQHPEWLLPRVNALNDNAPLQPPAPQDGGTPEDTAPQDDGTSEDTAPQDGGTPKDTAPQDGGTPKDKDVAAEKFTLKSNGFTPGWLTTSFSELSKGRMAPDIQEKPANSGMKDDDDYKEDSNDSDTISGMKNDDDSEEDSNDSDTMSLEGWRFKIPYAEREPIFQFVGGKRTGTCWHKIFEALDFTLFRKELQGSDAFLAQKSRVIDILDMYGQLGHTATRTALINAFMDMLARVCTQEIRIADEAPWRLTDIAPSACIHECDFTYRFRKSMTGNDLRNILDKYPEIGRDIRTDWMHGFSDKQMFTGSIDLLFQNPADGKFIIVDWKTNLLDANPASFTSEGVRQEMMAHVYPLQCILYAVAFIQYYCALTKTGSLGNDRKDAITRAYGRFGGCADLFVRGVREENGQLYGVYPIKPPLELLQELDACCGVTFGNNNLIP